MEIMKRNITANTFITVILLNLPEITGLFTFFLILKGIYICVCLRIRCRLGLFLSSPS